MRFAPAAGISWDADPAGVSPSARPLPYADRPARSPGCAEKPTQLPECEGLPDETYKAMFDNLALACRHMLDGPYGRALAPGCGISVLYGAPPPAIDLVMVSLQNHDCERPMFDPAGQPWPERLVHADEASDPFAFGARLRRVFAAHGLTRTLRERTLAINAIYPDAPREEADLWLHGDHARGAWRRFSTTWTALIIEQVRPKAVLLLGRKASVAIRRKLKGVPVVEAVHFAAPAAGHDDAVYQGPFERLARLLDAEP